jgi:phosphoribosylanthranilate isomerase
MKRKAPAAVAVAAKICGLSDEAALRAAIEGGAAYLGFVFIPESKRAITVDQTLALLQTLPQPTLCRFVTAHPLSSLRGAKATKQSSDAASAAQESLMPRGRSASGSPRSDFVSARDDGNGLVLVALLRDPTDEQVGDILRLKPLLGLIQLHGSETPQRVAAIRKAAGVPVMKAIAVADKGDLAAVLAYEKVSDMLLFDTKIGTKSGGTGQRFDWSILKGLKAQKPWMLAGGLNAENVREAISVTGAKIVDVSSSVETRTKKDPDKIRIFLARLSS